MARGAKDQEKQLFTYYGCSKGKFVTRVQEGVKGAVRRLLTKGDNEGKEVFEIIHDVIEGRLVWIESEFNEMIKSRQWKFEIDISPEKEPRTECILLSLPYSSGYAKNILSRLPALKFDADLILRGYNFAHPEKKDKSIIGISILQPTKLDSCFTRENPNGLPELKKIKVKGEDVWDDTEQLEFYEALVKKYLPKMEGSFKSERATADPVAAKAEPEATTQLNESQQGSEQEVNDDDLPF